MHPDAWHLTHDLDEFLARAGDFLGSRPDLHTVQLTVTQALRKRGLHLYSDQAPLFGTLEDESGTVRATLLHTPPFPVHPTPLGPQEAEGLAARLADLGRPVTGVTAERDTAASFAAAWQRRTGTAGRIHKRQRLYRLAELSVPQPVPEGRARVAGPADRDLLVRWYGAFMAEVGEPVNQDPGGWADARIGHGGITLWETPDGTPVSMAGATPETAGQVRVAPVYTPAHLRGHGYAGAATAEVSRAALDSGTAEVLLFTDLANPTSNGLYQRIGYRGVADFAVWEFGD
ncbi:acetyltransferase [Streptomyces cellostaticus]|uniref:Acetyltransferase n=1 Tax=Streptomyces cellostaticus TaxID=67285 RepID=A0A124HBP6_9ACTN|nr:GNAT family N-acetyltransferase [Streptomyces cellostaticus]KUM91911.1 acetyltransferase [Streptomyces cellostaticus]GHI06937.1 N-acetyltransferase [Streptomyces cellostaticus]